MKRLSVIVLILTGFLVPGPLPAQISKPIEEEFTTESAKVTK